MVETTLEKTSTTPITPESRIICRVFILVALSWSSLPLLSPNFHHPSRALIPFLRSLLPSWCQKQFSQYTCPRCNSRYCSLQCYKAHSIRCTESFMRENVMQELSQMQPEDETKQRMLGILQRFHAEERSDPCEINYDDGYGDDPVLSEETIQKILSGGRIDLEDLSESEMKQFQRAVASGELSKMIEPWNPWWLKPSARTLSLSLDGARHIRPVHNQETTVSPEASSEDFSSEIPAGPETPLPPVSHLSRTEPSPLLAAHLVDVVYSYCFTLRLYNGEWQSDPSGAATVVLSVSSVLGDGSQPETVAEALAFCLEQTCSPAYKHAGGLRFGSGLLDDVTSVLSLGRAVLVCLLCDLHRLIESGARELKHERSGKRNLRSKLKFAARKVYFLMCWVNEQPEEAWSSLAAIVAVEKVVVADLDSAETKNLKMEEKKECKSKMLIEEI